MSPEEIKALRYSLEMSQAEFAGLLGQHWITISCWETGKRNPRRCAVEAMEHLRDGHCPLCQSKWTPPHGNLTPRLNGHRGKEPINLDASLIDWFKPVIDIALENGVSVAYLYQLKKRLGIPNTWSGRSKHMGGIDPKLIDWSKSLRELACDYGVSFQRMQQIRIKAGIPSPRAHRKVI